MHESLKNMDEECEILPSVWGPCMPDCQIEELVRRNRDKWDTLICQLYQSINLVNLVQVSKYLVPTNRVSY